MGKKGTWISAIKRLFTSNSNTLNEAHKKSKDKRRGRFKHGSFFPLCREPSSIEQILGEIDQHNVYVPTTQTQQSQSQSQPQPQPQPQPQKQPQPQRQQAQPQSQPQRQPSSSSSSSSSSSGRPVSPAPQQRRTPPPSSSSSGRPVSPPQERRTPPPRITSPPAVVNQQPKISHRPEPTPQHHHLAATRIQAVYRGYMVRRKTRGLTGLVRLQRVVKSKSVKRQTVNAMKQMQLLIRVQTQIQSRRIQMLENQALKPQPNQNISHKQPDERWDDSLITKEEREARLQRKADAAIKRERAMAYAYSHQLRKDAPTSAHKMGRYPWWWRWVEHQLPYQTTPTPENHQFATTPSRSTDKQPDTPTTPMSSKSTNRWIKARKGASSLYSMKDDDSLRSCPPFSVPNYMSPTASARAKARPRPTSNPRESCVTPTTPCSVSSRRRFSSPFTPNTNRSPGSVVDVSMDSSVGRKPFNRFV